MSLPISLFLCIFAMNLSGVLTTPTWRTVILHPPVPERRLRPMAANIGLFRAALDGASAEAKGKTANGKTGRRCFHERQVREGERRLHPCISQIHSEEWQARIPQEGEGVHVPRAGGALMSMSFGGRLAGLPFLLDSRDIKETAPFCWPRQNGM